jgi:hypothetical protein
MRLANDPRLLASIAGGARIPDWVDSSISPDMAKEFQKRLRAGKFADVIDSTWSTDPVTARLLGEVRENKGDYSVVMEQHLKGLKRGSGAWFKQERNLATKLGRAIGGDNPEADIRMLEEGYLGTLGLKPPKGNGAWRPGMTGLEKEAAEKGADIERARGEAGAGKGVKEALGADPAKFAANALSSMKGMGQMVVAFDAGVQVFKDAVDKFATSMGFAPPTHAKGPKITRLPNQ